MEPDKAKKIEHSIETNRDEEKDIESRALTNGTKTSDNKVDNARSNTSKVPIVDRLLGLGEVYKLYQNKRIAKDLPDILFYLNLWHRMAIFLRLSHILLGIAATFFSLLAPAQIGSVANEQAKIFAFIAAVSIGLMTAFNLGGKSNDTRAAWRQLNAAVIKFNEGIFQKKDEVIKAYIEAEARIGEVTFQNK